MRQKNRDPGRRPECHIGALDEPSEQDRTREEGGPVLKLFKTSNSMETSRRHSVITTARIKTRLLRLSLHETLNTAHLLIRARSRCSNRLIYKLPTPAVLNGSELTRTK